MIAGRTEAQVAEAIRELVVKRYGDRVECRVEVRPDTDGEGDNVLRVTIMLEPISAFRDDVPVGFVRQVRNRLAAQDITDFPIISYVSKKDFGKRKLAAV